MRIRKWGSERWLLFTIEGHGHQFMWNMGTGLVLWPGSISKGGQAVLELAFDDRGRGLEDAIASADAWIQATERGEVTHWECDGCGQLRPAKGGETRQIGLVTAASIDPPEYVWVCDACLAEAEDAEVERYLDSMENWEDLYYYEK